jgi:hypothetical protein
VALRAAVCDGNGSPVGVLDTVSVDVLVRVDWVTVELAVTAAVGVDGSTVGEAKPVDVSAGVAVAVMVALGAAVGGLLATGVAVVGDVAVAATASPLGGAAVPAASAELVPTATEVAEAAAASNTETVRAIATAVPDAVAGVSVPGTAARLPLCAAAVSNTVPAAVSEAAGVTAPVGVATGTTALGCVVAGVALVAAGAATKGACMLTRAAAACDSRATGRARVPLRERESICDARSAAELRDGSSLAWLISPHAATERDSSGADHTATCT